MYHHDQMQAPPGFTLIELVVVVSLMTLLLGLAALRLHGVSDTARLRSSASQIERVVRLAQSEALFAGEPRLLEYTDVAEVRVRRPILADGTWAWDDGRMFSTGHRVTLAGVLGLPVRGEQTVRITAHGAYLEHAVLLRRTQRHVALVLEPNRNRVVLLERPPLTDSLELLLAEIDVVHDTE